MLKVSRIKSEVLNIFKANIIFKDVSFGVSIVIMTAPIVFIQKLEMLIHLLINLPFIYVCMHACIYRVYECVCLAF